MFNNRNHHVPKSKYGPAGLAVNPNFIFKNKSPKVSKDDEDLKDDEVKKVVIIGIAGKSGAGKTTLTRDLVDHYGKDQCTMISADDYYHGCGGLSPTSRREINFNLPNSLDFDLMLTHLKQLKDGQAADIPKYDFMTSSRLPETTQVNPTPLIIVEGILVLHPEALRKMFDYTIYLDTDDDICLANKLQRDRRERNMDLDVWIKKYRNKVRPAAKALIEPCKDLANLVLKIPDHQDNGHVEFDISELTEKIDEIRSCKNSNMTNIRFSQCTLKLLIKPEQPEPMVKCSDNLDANNAKLSPC